MNPTLKEIYDFAFVQWPFVAAAYALLWAGLMLYVGFALKRLKGLGKQLEVLEAAMARRAGAE